MLGEVKDRIELRKYCDDEISEIGKVVTIM